MIPSCLGVTQDIFYMCLHTYVHTCLHVFLHAYVWKYEFMHDMPALHAYPSSPLGGGGVWQDLGGIGSRGGGGCKVLDPPRWCGPHRKMSFEFKYNSSFDAIFAMALGY